MQLAGAWAAFAQTGSPNGENLPQWPVYILENRATMVYDLPSGQAVDNQAPIRQCTHTGRPLGSTEFVRTLEGLMKRRLAPQKGGRPPKARLDARQSELAFEPE